MNSNRRPSFGGLAGALAAQALVSFLFPSHLPGFVEKKTEVEEAALNRERIESVLDSFDWADGIITALGDLAPDLGPPSPLPSKLNRPRRKQHAILRHANALRVSHLFEGRHLRLHKNTVFGIFDVTVDEIGPGFFSLQIGSTEPAENIQIRDRVSKVILVDQPLDDENLFVVRVHRKLTPKIVVSVSVLQDGEINKAYFPLLGGDGRN